MKKPVLWAAIFATALVFAGCQKKPEPGQKTAAIVPAQDRLVSGEPFSGYLQGTLIEADGPIVKEQMTIEGPSLSVTVEGKTIRLRPLSESELVSILPETAIGGSPAETLAYPQLRFLFRLR